jgi:pSer/pThr/pTyr-binding forkhead associated (FHA) protein
VERSRDNTYVGKSIPVTHVPFTLGRRERDLSFENDPGVSREHAQITYENNTYFITDNGSTNHTFVDEVDIGAHSPRPLYNGAAIRLGTSTVMTFRIEESSGYDSDKTMPDINY